MKQIEKVSIGGYAFTLETEAAAELDSYLKEMSSYYSNPEITEGIEERMAELLRERVGENGVASKAVILSIIDILGRPERIAQDEPDDAAPDKEEKPSKKLYRDMEGAKLAGVCSGLSAYFNMDPSILRIAFVALTILGILIPWNCHMRGVVMFGPVLYVILWICMPAARTAQQRWQMRGDDGTAESIRRNIESGAKEVGNALREVGNSPAWGSAGRVVEVIVGLMLLVISVSGLFAGGLAVFGWQWLGLTELFNNITAEITAEFPQLITIMAEPWVKMLALAVYGLPFIGMLYSSIMLLFHIKSPSWRPGLIIFVLWLIAIIAFGILVSASYLSTITV